MAGSHTTAQRWQAMTASERRAANERLEFMQEGRELHANLLTIGAAIESAEGDELRRMLELVEATLPNLEMWIYTYCKASKQ